MSSGGKERFEALFYPGTQTLVNRFNERDPQKLAELERLHTAAAAYDILKLNKVEGGHDLAHLREIHRRLFGDVYQWAGEIRDYPLFKKRADGFTTEFARPEEIPVLDQKLRAIMADTDGFARIAPGHYVETLTKTYQTLNDMHPFREGNGRSQRILLTYLAERAGYELRYSDVAPDAWNHAASLAARINIGNGERIDGRTTELAKVFAHISHPLQPMNAYQKGREGLSSSTHVLTLAELAPGFKPGYAPSRRLR